MDLNRQYPIAQNFKLERKEVSDEGWLTCIGLEAFDSNENQWTQWLHPEEKAYYQSSLVKKRKKSFLLGRVCAKASYLQAIPQQDASKINIRTGIFKDPVLQNQSATQWQIGITHSNTIAAALVFPATHPMAIDVEEWDTKRTKTMKTQCEAEELHCLEEIGLSSAKACAVCWTAKEAVSKALRTGMTCPFELFGIKAIKPQADGGITGLFTNFCQYQFRSWVIEDKVLSIVLPKRTRLIFPENGPHLANSAS
jgi:4'-phosphopantetheinyl transferase